MKKRFAAACARLAPKVFSRGTLVDVIGLAGLAALVNGIRMVHEPSAWMAGGALGLVFAVVVAWRTP